MDKLEIELILSCEQKHAAMLSSVQNSRAFPIKDTGSDHQLVMANIKLKLKKNRTPVSINKIDIKKLKDPSTREVSRGSRK